ncbi:MAG: methylamine utilization protein MauG [Rhodobacterales bacterium]|nr:MAG: methylamine utilization protein MauG [Rhodobacterales bacterium]
MKFLHYSALALVLSAGGALASENGVEIDLNSLETLGEQLFFDVNLSKNRTQSCATCHTPEAGFADARESAAGRMASLGDDGVSIGDRNAPTASYANQTPRFHRTEEGEWIGGQFLDGREPDLEGQAGGPPLNPVEMGMPDKASVVERIRENPDYIAAFEALYGAEIFDDVDAAYRAMTEAIAAFERTSFFSPFDSRYDRALRGEIELTKQEELGRLLFFSEQFTNCNLCHQLRRSALAPDETFANYEYHNIGVPENTALREVNGVTQIDRGLWQNPAVEGDPATLGQFKVPTLRNVAVTGPYMHNGVFEDLRTVILFYNKYNSRSEARQINPETGEPFRPPEIPGTLAMEELTHGPALDDKRIDALVAFLKTLTDARYEDLLEE